MATEICNSSFAYGFLAGVAVTIVGVMVCKKCCCKKGGCCQKKTE